MSHSQISLAEKIETIAMACQSRGSSEGAFGRGYAIHGIMGAYTIEIEGKAYKVRCVAEGWAVQLGSVIRMEKSLLEAAHQVVLATQ